MWSDAPGRHLHPDSPNFTILNSYTGLLHHPASGLNPVKCTNLDHDVLQTTPPSLCRHRYRCSSSPSSSPNVQFIIAGWQLTGMGWTLTGHFTLESEGPWPTIQNPLIAETLPPHFYTKAWGPTWPKKFEGMNKPCVESYMTRNGKCFILDPPR